MSFLYKSSQLSFFAQLNIKLFNEQNATAMALFSFYQPNSMK